MSGTLQKLRLAALKAERRAQELEERENYLSKLLGGRALEVAELEQTLAKMEKDLHVKEEKWRLQDNDRMRQYFSHKLGAADSMPGDRAASQALKSGRPHTAAGGSGFRTTAEKSAHEALHEEQASKLAQEVAQLKDEVLYKDSVIRKLKSWRDTDAYVGAGEDGMQDDVLEAQRVKFQAVHEQENKEMADAAYQTIKTLNEMLEQKKTQVRSKEEQIERLRQQLAEQRELHAEQCMKLQAEVTATGKSTLANLHRLVSNEREVPTSAGGDRKAAQ